MGPTSDGPKPPRVSQCYEGSKIAEIYAEASGQKSRACLPNERIISVLKEESINIPRIIGILNFGLEF